MTLYVAHSGHVRYGWRLGPIGVAFVVTGWLIMAVFVGIVALAIALALLGSIAFALVALGADRLLVATSPSWRARRTARGPIRRPLLLIAAIVGAMGFPKGQKRRTLGAGVKVAAAVGKVIPEASPPRRLQSSQQRVDK